jgi:hypothetical protein
VPDDEAVVDLRLGGWLPSQRPGTPPELPGWAADDKTQVLPAFLTGRPGAPEPPAADAAKPAVKNVTPKAPDSHKLPSSERNMLIFVASLLAVGTLAVVTVMGIGALTKHEATPPTPTGSSSPR